MFPVCSAQTVSHLPHACTPCFCSSLSRARGLTAISCPHLVELKEGRELKQQAKSCQKGRRWETRVALSVGRMSPGEGKAAGLVRFPGWTSFPTKVVSSAGRGGELSLRSWWQEVAA